MKKTEALKLALEALEDRASLMKWQMARDAIKEALAQPEQEPVAWIDLEKLAVGGMAYATSWKTTGKQNPLYTTPPQRKPQFKEFIKWAGAQGYDCAQTCNSGTGEWIVLNPMTADLWKAWQAAHGIKEH